MSIEQFGRFVAEERKKKAMTQDQLASVLGISGKAVSKWERGLNYPDIGLLEKLALTLEVSVAELLKGQRNAPNETVSIEEVDQAVSNTLSFTKRIVTRQRKGFLIVLASILVLSFLTIGFLEIDRRPPVILSAELVGDEIRINAKDDKGEVAYLVSFDDIKPESDDLRWTSFNIIRVNSSAAYTVWVQDKVHHMVKFEKALIYTSVQDKQAWVDTMFMHLTWADQATGIKVVNSISYDLDDLRQEYGDLYWFVEPLSWDEFNKRFDYMVWWSMVFPKEGNWDPYTGLKKNAMVDQLIDARVQEVFRIIKNSSGQKLNQYASLIRYDVKTKRYGLSVTDQLDCRVSVLCLNNEYYNRIDHLSLDLYLRTFAFLYEKRLAAYQELDLDLSHYWEQEP